MKKEISIAKDFTPSPAGRYMTDGPFSGERFREEILYPAIKNENITELNINLNGLEGVGSSFWDEAFGGLIRTKQLTIDEIRKKMQISSDDASLIRFIWSFITDANEEH